MTFFVAVVYSTRSSFLHFF